VTGLAPGPFGLTLLVTAAALLVLQGLTFAVASRIKKHSVVDTAWGIGIALAALTAFLTSINHGQAERRYLLLAASLLWGLRLAGYVGWRNHGQPEDPRERPRGDDGNRKLATPQHSDLSPPAATSVDCPSTPPADGSVRPEPTDCH